MKNRFTPGLITAFVFLFAGIFLLQDALELVSTLGQERVLFGWIPVVVMVILIVAASIVLARELKQGKKPENIDWRGIGQTLGVVALSGLFLLMLMYISWVSVFLYSSAVSLLISYKDTTKTRAFLVSLGSGIGVTLICYGLFGLLFGFDLPEGVF